MAAARSRVEVHLTLPEYFRIAKLLKLLDEIETLMLYAQEDLEYLVDRDTEGYASCAWHELEDALAKVREMREMLEAWLRGRD